MKKWLPLILFSLLLSVFLFAPAPVFATSEPLPPEPLADVVAIVTPAPKPVTLGEDIRCYVGMSNSGPATAENATLSMTLPAGTVFKAYSNDMPGYSAITPAIGSTGTLQVTLPALAAGSIMNSTLTVTPSGAPRTLVFTAAVSSTTTDPVPGNNTVTDTVEFLAPTADVAVTLSDGETVGQIGRMSTYTLTLFNNGPDEAKDVSVTADLPAQTTFQAFSSSPGITAVTPAAGSGGTVTLAAASLASGASATAQVSVMVLGTPRTLTFTATASASSFDQNLANNSASDANTIYDTPPALVPAHAIITGAATPAAANGNPEAVPFTVDMAGWFTDILNRALTYRIVQAQDNAAEPNDVSAQAGVSGSQLTYAPAAAQAGRTVTILVKANNGTSDSGEIATAMVVVQPQPLNRYIVDFDANGGTPAPVALTIAHGSKIPEPAAMIRIGYDFTGWRVGEASGALWNFASQTVSGPLTLQAGWQKTRYPITYQLGSGTNAPANPAYFSIGDEPIVLLAPTRDGFRFDGWFDAETGGNPVTSISPQSLAPITLYAHWTALPGPIPVTGESGAGPASYAGFALLLGAAALLLARRAIRSGEGIQG